MNQCDLILIESSRRVFLCGVEKTVLMIQCDLIMILISHGVKVGCVPVRRLEDDRAWDSDDRRLHRCDRDARAREGRPQTRWPVLLGKR